MSEWSKEVVLKTIEPQGSVGSNPTFSVGDQRDWNGYEGGSVEPEAVHDA